MGSPMVLLHSLRTLIDNLEPLVIRILFFIFIDMSNNRVTRTDTFRLAFTRRKINELFKGPMVKAVLLTELGEMGPDVEMIVKLLDKVQLVKPVQLPRQQQAANANVVQPFDRAKNVKNSPPRPQDGSSEKTALDVLDSNDELVNDLGLNQRQEQRLRRQLLLWRERDSSSSDSSQSTFQRTF